MYMHTHTRTNMTPNTRDVFEFARGGALLNNFALIGSEPYRVTPILKRGFSLYAHA